MDFNKESSKGLDSSLYTDNTPWRLTKNLYKRGNFFVINIDPWVLSKNL